MKKILCILFVLLLCGCEKVSLPHADTEKNVYETFSNMQSYSAKIKVFTYSNTNENTYEMTQYYAYPDKYRSEYAGGSAVINKEKAAVWYDNVKTKELFDKISDEKNFMYLNSFFEKYYSDEEANVKSSGKNDKLLTLNVDTGLKNEYKSSASLILNTQNMMPVSLKLTDDKGNVSMKIEYVSFKLNTSPEEKLFAVN